MKSFLLLFALLFTFIACTPDDQEVPEIVEELPGVDIDDEVESDQGSIGISISTRNLARKGYIAATADILVISETGNFSKLDIPFDELTNIALLRYEVDSLSEEQSNELRNGVDLTVRIKDDEGNTLLIREYSKTSFLPSPEDIEMPASDFENRYSRIALREQINHYVQVVSSDNTVLGGPDNSHFSNATDHPLPIEFVPSEELNYETNTSALHTAFRFREIPEKPNVFNISRHHGDDIHYVYFHSNGFLSIQTKRNLIINGGNTNAEDLLNYQFLIEKADEGKYTITPLVTGIPVSLSGEDNLFESKEDLDPSYFRIFSLDIDWQVQSLGTSYMQPILPAAETASAFNSTLRNCSSGPLEQKVGQSETISSTSTVEWSESMSVSSKNTTSVSVTVGAEVETKFFGSGGTASVSATGGYEYTKEATQTRTQSSSFEETESVTVSFERTITVLPGTATQVLDIYQTYENIRIPFVQRFRIKGTFQDNNEPLTGEEVVSQFNFNSFTGVITEVGDDFIEVTVRGNNHINRLIDTRTSADDIPADCNN